MQSKKAIIVGTAPCWNNDVNYVKDIDERDIVGINYAYALLPKIDFWYVYDFLQYNPIWYKQERSNKRLDNINPILIGPPTNGYADITHKPIGLRSGTGALFATMFMCCMGYDDIIITGCPLDDSGNVNQNVDVNGYFRYRNGWNDAYDQNVYGIRDKVRSVSGYIAELYGKVRYE